ncbi:Glycoside hydrolase 18 protein [Penicillium citrinum]|uniref:Glycoside hydrolase 18 protein n=1 Tax=Penicillium citrinum TaxID=5077 RepID=A0A9W9PGN3_PENCI|nr:Glycoside hydrolase 18 protein [Penicillium citrinum]KAJ5242638.1 Glycoside hydrolase 18 protein [Penicillium citrinum]
MRAQTLATALPLLMLASSAVAVDCSTHSFTTCADKIVHWFDPDTGEICDPLDCGGGRAPPKTDVPGCPMYTGTETRATSKSYLPCWTPSATATPTSESSAEVTSSTSDSTTVTETSAPTVSSTTAVVTTHATTTSEGAAISSPSTTPAASLFHGSNSASAQTTTAFNAGGALTGSFVAVAGAALGVIALI